MSTDMNVAAGAQTQTERTIAALRKRIAKLEAAVKTAADDERALVLKHISKMSAHGRDDDVAHEHPQYPMNRVWWAINGNEHRSAKR